MQDTYAIVDSSGVVTNIVLWDGGADWSPPSGHTAIDIAGLSIQPSIGWSTADGGQTFQPPISSPAS